MKFLSNGALERLRDGADAPDLSGTRYRLLDRIARGGMGVVHTAEDEKLQRRVALKVLDVPGTDGDLAKPADSRSARAGEARASGHRAGARRGNTGGWARFLHHE